MRSQSINNTITLFCAILMFGYTSILADTFYVTNTKARGPGSLRQAIVDANNNSGPDFIKFNIPKTDQGFDGKVWTIFTDRLPSIDDDGTKILGSSQKLFQGDTNPGQSGTGGFVGVDKLKLYRFNNPEIQIRTGGRTAFVINGTASDIELEGLAIFDAKNAVYAYGLTRPNQEAGTNRVLRNMYIGPNARGEDPGQATRTRQSGVYLGSSLEQNGPSNLIVERSFIAFNGKFGVLGAGPVSELFVKGSELSSNGMGIYDDVSANIQVDGEGGGIEANLIHNARQSNNDRSSLTGAGVQLGPRRWTEKFEGGRMTLANNTIKGNLGGGVCIHGGSTDNYIVKNVIEDNYVGVFVSSTDDFNTAKNKISQNHIRMNELVGIDINYGSPFEVFDGVTPNNPQLYGEGANNHVMTPFLTSAREEGNDLVISGYAQESCIIEFYEAQNEYGGFGQGARYLGSLTEGSSRDSDSGDGVYGPMAGYHRVSTEPVNAKKFTVRMGRHGLKSGNLITANCTMDRSSSEFGHDVRISGNDGVAAEAEMSATAYPNPFNPTTNISYTIDESTDLTLKIFGLAGREITTLASGIHEPGNYSVQWDASSVPSGVYLYRLGSQEGSVTGRLVLHK